MSKASHLTPILNQIYPFFDDVILEQPLRRCKNRCVIKSGSTQKNQGIPQHFWIGPHLPPESNHFIVTADKTRNMGQEFIRNNYLGKLVDVSSYTSHQTTLVC